MINVDVGVVHQVECAQVDDTVVPKRLLASNGNVGPIENHRSVPLVVHSSPEKRHF